MSETTGNGSSASNPNRIVVGVDGSDYSTGALRLAGRLAAALGAPLEAVTCWSPLDSYAAADLPVGSFPEKGQLEDEAKRLVVQAAERAFGTNPPARMDITVRYGPTAKILVEESRTAQMLVVGRRGRGGFLGQVMGSVSSVCSAHAHCPVVVVGEDAEDGAPAH
ncbi:MAG TPA: universal stress protein [Micrococcaceae bacterium]|jgi:nucleotide-binding universal stress UspA family protein